MSFEWASCWGFASLEPTPVGPGADCRTHRIRTGVGSVSSDVGSGSPVRVVSAGSTRATAACFIHADCFGYLTVGTTFAKRVIEFAPQCGPFPALPGTRRPARPSSISAESNPNPPNLVDYPFQVRWGCEPLFKRDSHMYTCTCQGRASDLRSLRSGLKSASGEVKADFDARKVAVHSSEKDTDVAGGLTLDDFGGRSDALGG